ncbi:MAG: virulence factor [Maritimibacter sp.]|nr:virulence factor [Maritimibacter sp.]
MPGLTIVYWRDIPAQVMVGKGRTATRAELPPRFAEAIDRAAMKAGAAGTDAYLADWRRDGPVETAGTPDEIVAAWTGKLDADYPPERLRTLIDNGGRA